MAAHSLARIKGSLVNTPHLIEQSSFDSIMEYVNSRIEGNVVDVTPEAKLDDFGGPTYVSDTATGVMYIDGPLTYRTSGWEALCGGTSYEMLKGQMEYFVEEGAKTVVMMVNSGGGEAHGMMDSANYLRKLADDNGIKIIAYVDGMSASAAYGISCIADEIVMSSDSQVGSIGVLIQLMNNSKQLEKAGIERTFITAGEDKVPFAADGSFTDAFKERLQTQVDVLYESFTGHVATHRGLDIKAVKNTQANVFMANEALELGLADSVMTVEEFYDYVADAADANNKGGNTMKGALKFMNREDKTEMAKLQELEALLSAETIARVNADDALAEFTQKLTAQTELVASLTSQLEGFKQAQADAAQAAAEAALATRKAALAEVVPETELESYMTNMSALDEASFSFMVGQLGVAKAARAASFVALGEDGAEEEDAPMSTTEAIRTASIEAARARR
jgi:signal peptide peptidase SppA